MNQTWCTLPFMECIPWTGRINEFGYGTLGPKLAHRVAWEQTHGPIPDGMTIDHLCHDPAVCRGGVKCSHRSCVNVDHMTLVTAKQNRQRSYHRSVLITHCPEGHPYSGDNLLVSGGKRYCRECRRVKSRQRKHAKAVQRCREHGHERVEGVGADGRIYCVICAAEHGTQTAAVRERTELGSWV